MVHHQLLERFFQLRQQLRDNYKLLAYILNYFLVAKLSTDYHDVALYNRQIHNFTLTEMPRGTYKTTTLTIIETIQDILKNRDIRILICHFAGANARDMLKEISAHFINNPHLRLLFPEIVPQNTKRPETQWTDDAITVQRSKTKKHLKEGTVEALGSEQSMASKHFDKIKFDDLVTEQSTTTIDQIKKSINFLLRSYSLLNNHDPNRNLSVTGTEWVPDDAMVQLKKGQVLAPDGNPFHLFRIPAETTDPKTNARTPLFPDILSLKVLDGLRASQRTTYHAFYLLDAEEFEDQVWSKKKITYYTSLPDNKSYKVYGAIDPALTTQDLKNGCDSAMAIIAKCDNNELYLLDYILAKGVDPLYPAFFQLHNKWKNIFAVKPDGTTTTTKLIGTFRFFSVETTLFQQLIAKELRKQMGQKNHWIPLRESNPTKEKTKRILSALDPLITNGAFHIKPEHTEAYTQITRFGRPGQKVDLLDAIAQAEIESSIVHKTQQKKQIDDEYEEMYREARIV